MAPNLTAQTPELDVNAKSKPEFQECKRKGRKNNDDLTD
jgi:hypothetical protein